MKIKCPDCSTSYEIKPEALGPEGRSVKCAKCGNRWFVAPKPEEGEIEPEEEAGEVVSAAGKDEADWQADALEDETPDVEDDIQDDLPEPVEEPSVAAQAPAPATADEEKFSEDLADDEEPVDPAKADIETLAKRPKINVNPNKFRRNRIGAILNWMMRWNYRRIAGIGIFAFAVAICASFILMRGTLVKQSPDLASLFQMIGFDVNLRGLEFRNLRTFTELQDGKQVLVVEGSIRNLNDKSNTVPAVRLSVRSADLQEIYAWTVVPRTKALNGLDETRFRTMLADPPEGAADIQVRFVDRGQRNIVLE